MSRGTWFRECPLCGCKLDPGERCDCQDEAKTTEPVPAMRTIPERVSVGVAPYDNPIIPEMR